MHRSRISALGKVLLLAALLIVMTPAVSADEFKPIPAEDSHIIFRSKHFAGIVPQVYRRDFTHGFGEYVSYFKGGSQAQIYFVRVATNRYFPDRSMETPKKTIKSWDYFKNKEITWDISGKKGSSRGLFRYQKFLIGSEKRECVSFTSAWGVSIGDELGKTKIMHGYFCKPIGESLSTDEIRNLTRDIEIKG